jgi:hypothetical protein
MQIPVQFWIIGVVLLLALVSKFSTNCSGRPKSTIDHVRTLLKQSLRWKSIAEQDAQPLVAFAHSNYATAYMHAARICMDYQQQDLEKISKLDISKTVQLLESNQQRLLDKIGQLCPSVAIRGNLSILSAVE